MKSNIIVGISLIFASAVCVLAFAMIDPSTHIGAPLIVIAWLIYLGFGFYLIVPDKPSGTSSNPRSNPLPDEEKTENSIT